MKKHSVINLNEAKGLRPTKKILLMWRVPGKKRGNGRAGGSSSNYGLGLLHPALFYCSEQIGKNLVWFLINGNRSGDNLE